jgi:sortase A
VTLASDRSVAPLARLRRPLRLLGTLMVVVGALTLVWVVVVWRWQDPFTAIQTYLSQRHLRADYARRSRIFRLALPAVPHNAAAAREDEQRAALKYESTLHAGDPVGRLKIGRIGLSIYVVQGTDHETLKKGPGHYAESALPGEGRLIYIAGHRTTYLAPFANIDDIRIGDYMTLTVPYGTFTYRATRHYVVPSDDLAVLRSHGREILRLQACHPRFFATHRYIVDAALVAFAPAGEHVTYSNHSTQQALTASG